MIGIHGEERRRFIGGLEQALTVPAARCALHGNDAEAFADSIVTRVSSNTEVRASRGPYSTMRQLAERFGMEWPTTRSERHATLRDAFASQTGLVIVRDAERVDAESRQWLSSLVAISTGPSLLLVSETETAFVGFAPFRVPRLDADGVAEWFAKPDVVQALLDASGGSELRLAAWLGGRGAPTSATRPDRALRFIVAAGGLSRDVVRELTGACASDLEWQRLGVRTVGLELRAFDVSLDCHEVREELGEFLWKRGAHIDAMHQWLEAGSPLALKRLEDLLAELERDEAYACAAELLDRIRESGGPELARRRIRLLKTMGAWGSAREAARSAHVRSPSAESAFELASLLVLTGRASEAADLVRENTDSALRWMALRAEIAFQAGALEDAVCHAKSVLDDGAAATSVTLDAWQTLAKSSVDDDEHALALYDGYLAAAEAAGSLRHQSLAASGRGVALIRMRRLQDANHALEEGDRLAKHANDAKCRALASHNLGVLAHLDDRYADARAHYEDALTWLRALAHTPSLARCAFNLGELYEQLGASKRALTMADLGTQLGGPFLPPAASAEGALLRGRALVALGETKLAEAVLDAAAERADLLDVSRRVGLSIVRARVDILEGRPEAALDRLAACPEGIPSGRAAELALTRAAALRRMHGPLGRELDAARAALALAEESGMSHRVLDALVAVAQALEDRGEAAETFWNRARTLDARLEAFVPKDMLTGWNARPVRRLLDRSTHADAAAIVGVSSALRSILDWTDRVAPTRCTVLIRGESGTGKELVAEAIHRRSGRRGSPLVRVSCAALVESLLLSELFGHERGAFTGATERREGRFELADGGTLFLDEVGELSPRVQSALLRVLQQRSFERVGGVETISVDVRVVAATHRDLEAMVRTGAFREDLYYRLNEVSIRVPPLRERREDIPVLVRHTLERLHSEQGIPRKSVSDQAMAVLRSYAWPGNVRQLENVVQAAALFALGPMLGAEDFQLPADPSVPTRADETDAYARVARGEISLRELKKELERACVVRALAENGGNITRAAELLGMKRPRVSQLVKEYGLSTKASGARGTKDVRARAGDEE